jgi:putative membrane protein (TIGR04086 family)
MKCLKNIGISCLYSYGFLFVLTFVLSFLNYTNLIDGMFTFFMIFNLVISVFIGGFYTGKCSIKNGWLEGVKFGFVFLIILALLNVLGFSNSLSIKFFVFCSIILVSSVLGGMVGIGFSREKK